MYVLVERDSVSRCCQFTSLGPQNDVFFVFLSRHIGTSRDSKDKRLDGFIEEYSKLTDYFSFFFLSDLLLPLPLRILLKKNTQQKCERKKK